MLAASPVGWLTPSVFHRLFIVSTSRPPPTCAAGPGTTVYFCRTGGCGLNVFFVTFNLILSIVASLMSIHPRVQEAKPSSGLLQASIVVIYNTYVVASAMSDEVNEPGVFECNTIADSSTHTVRIPTVVLVVWRASLLTAPISFRGPRGRDSRPRS